MFPSIFFSEFLFIKLLLINIVPKKKQIKEEIIRNIFFLKSYIYLYSIFFYFLLIILPVAVS